MKTSFEFAAVFYLREDQVLKICNRSWKINENDGFITLLFRR